MTDAFQILIASDLAQLTRRGAELFLREARDSTRRRGRFTVALSGGSTPRPLHRLLAAQPIRDQVPWAHTHVFWVDERRVPLEHPHSNCGTARLDFLDTVPLLPPQVHCMPLEGSLEKAARSYQTELSAFFGTESREPPIFDLILLGIGSDGHTASLFPGQPLDEDPDIWVLGVHGGDPAVDRLSLSLAVLNQARHLVFLVSGQGKAAVVKALLQEPTGPLPAASVWPHRGRLTWLLDRDAAALLNPDDTRIAWP